MVLLATGTILDNNATPVLNIKAEPNTAIEGSDDPIVFNIEQSGLSDKATSVTVKLDLQDVDASDIDSIVLTNTDGSTQTITVADAIAGIKVSIPAVQPLTICQALRSRLSKMISMSSLRHWA
ncbi:hypothetical protein [Psychrobacter sanguinis]|uniref:hypothetical protein n=1 Tax=Psychrobacter sanguinis TaxID=861445 RepID=UPI001D132F90|nr:hypothetical protein [Psychrobacter sanguinis]UEC25589.1 hypothetical protein LK453_00100 [Psychrobacter sanguinis]